MPGISVTPTMCHSCRASAPRIQALQLGDQAGRGGLGVGDHVLLRAEEVVERQQVDGRDPGAVGDRVLEDRQLGGWQPGRERRQRVGELDREMVRRRPVLGLRDGLVTAVDPGGVGNRGSLDVQVDPGYVIGPDQALEYLRDRVHARAAVGELGASRVGCVAAERRDHVAASRLDRRDVGTEAGRPDRRAGVAIPVGGARAGRGRLQERQRQELRAGRRRQRGQAAAGVIRLEVRREDPIRKRARGALGMQGGGAGAAGKADRQRGRGGGGQPGQERGVTSHARSLWLVRLGEEINRKVSYLIQPRR